MSAMTTLLGQTELERRLTAELNALRGQLAAIREAVSRRAVSPTGRLVLVGLALEGGPGEAVRLEDVGRLLGHSLDSMRERVAHLELGHAVASVEGDPDRAVLMLWGAKHARGLVRGLLDAARERAWPGAPVDVVQAVARFAFGGPAESLRLEQVTEGIEVFELALAEVRERCRGDVHWLPRRPEMLEAAVGLWMGPPRPAEWDPTRKVEV